MHKTKPRSLNMAYPQQTLELLAEKMEKEIRIYALSNYLGRREGARRFFSEMLFGVVSSRDFPRKLAKKRSKDKKQLEITGSKPLQITRSNLKHYADKINQEAGRKIISRKENGTGKKRIVYFWLDWYEFCLWIITTLGFPEPSSSRPSEETSKKNAIKIFQFCLPYMVKSTEKTLLEDAVEKKEIGERLPQILRSPNTFVDFFYGARNHIELRAIYLPLYKKMDAHKQTLHELTTLAKNLTNDIIRRTEGDPKLKKFFEGEAEKYPEIKKLLSL